MVMLYQMRSLDPDRWKRSDYAERFPGYPDHGVEFILNNIEKFEGIYLFREDCYFKYFRKIDHCVEDGFLILRKFDDLNKKAIRHIRGSSHENGAYSVFYRSGDPDVLREFCRMCDYPGEIIEQWVYRKEEDIRDIERLMSRLEPREYCIAFSHDTVFAGIFGDLEFLKEVQAEHHAFCKLLGKTPRPPGDSSDDHSRQV
jgi:hypothetical protein